MSQLTLSALRLGFLAALWLFILAALSVIRTDLFGSASRRQQRGGSPSYTPPTVRGNAQRPRRGVPSRLVVTGGPLSGTTVNLTNQQITVGRAHDSTIVLDDDYASSRHARVYPDPSGQWLVEDLGSTNGTYLDRTKITVPTPVPLGMPIRIGKTVLELRK